jgi:hypothetical protein
MSPLRPQIVAAVSPPADRTAVDHMPSIGHIRCSGCERTLVVMPARLADDACADRSGLSKALGRLKGPAGSRYTLAEPDGFFACPACAMPGFAVNAGMPAVAAPFRRPRPRMNAKTRSHAAVPAPEHALDPAGRQEPANLRGS